MTIRFLRVAQSELDEAMAVYKSISPRLAQAFGADVLAKLEQVDRYPISSPELAPDLRHAPLRRFPFVLLYTLAGSDVVVLAVAHMRQKPRAWRDRLLDV